MELEVGGIRTEFDLRFVEETVLLATDALPREGRRAFHRERDPIYDRPDPAERETCFRRLHETWFVRLRLADPVFRLLAEHPGLPGAVSRILVLYALSGKEEGADLHGSREPAAGAAGATAPPPVLVLRLRPRSLLRADDLVTRLRRELLHVADMLDPSFGYDPARRVSDDGPSRGTLVLGRFRVLWDTSVDGRLQARGLLPQGGEEMRRRDFLTSFGRFSPSAERTFRRLFDGPRPTSEEMLAIASTPAEDLMGGMAAGDADGPAASDSPAAAVATPAFARCPLCRFPTTAFHPDARALDTHVLDMLREDFPAWTPGDRICIQCADLYSARITTRG